MRRHEAGRRRVRCGAGHPEKQAQVIDRPPQSLVMPVLLLFIALLVPRCAFAQQGARPGDGRKRAQAVRVPSGSIDVNGRLDDSAWRDVPALTEFVQKEPVEGATPTDRMEVRFAYDDRALYVGARMYSTDPIRSPLGRRDDGDQAEHLIVSLDPYLDRRTASTFGVTAAGVRLDRFYPQDDDFPSDAGFNPVWRARTSIDQAGWTAELWIPFSQLRFTDRDPQVWGLNVQRFVPSQNEEVFWALIPRTEERWTHSSAISMGSRVSSRLADSSCSRTRRIRPRSLAQRIPARRSRNLVLRWEWRPGSTLYLVWQQDRASEDMLRSRASVADMFESVGQRGDNYIVVKASFWFSPS